MKTAKNTGLGLILVLLVCFAVICGCKEGKADNPPVSVEDGTFPGLDAETERRIKQTRFDKWLAGLKVAYENREPTADFYFTPDDHPFTVDDFGLSGYYGTYNGYVVIAYDRVQEFVEGINIGGIQLPWEVDGWKDGVMYRLSDLYEQGLLTHEDLLMIQTMQKQGKGGGL